MYSMPPLTQVNAEGKASAESVTVVSAEGKKVSAITIPVGPTGSAGKTFLTAEVNPV